MSKLNIEGMDELKKTISTLEKLPQRCVTNAVKKGANIGLKSAKSSSPVDMGYLKKALKLKGEKSKDKGKKVYETILDANMNDVFVKTTKDGKRYYYPASQEYGFQTKDGKYIPGYHYLQDSIDDNKEKIEKEIVDVLSNEIDKLE